MSDSKDTKSAEDFIRHAKTQKELRDAFRAHLKNIYQAKWSRRGAFKRDPLVIDYCRSGYRPESVLRSILREIDPVNKEKKITLKIICQIAKLLGQSLGDLITDVYSYAANSESFKSRPAKFCVASNGYYSLEVGVRVTDDEGVSYQITQIYDKPDQLRGDSYVGRAVVTGQEVFIKTLSLPSKLTIDEIQKRVKYCDRYYRQEKNSLGKLGEYNVPGVSQFHGYGQLELELSQGPNYNESYKTIYVPFLVQDFIEGKNLFEVMKDENCARHVRSDPGLFIHYVRQCLSVLKDVHRYGIRHGDVRPDNFMVTGDPIKYPSLSLVDFGQSAFAGAPRNPSVSGRSKMTTSNYALDTSRDQAIPLEITDDLYSVGEVIYWLATGRHFERQEVEATSDDMHTMLREQINASLLEANEGILFAICQCLHNDRNNRAADAGEVLSTIDLFQSITSSARKETNVGAKSALDIKLLSQAARRIPKATTNNPFFRDTIRRDMDRTTRRINEIVDLGYAEITGSRDEVITALLSFMSLLQPEDRYYTNTTIDYWRPNNLGIAGRFLAANKILAQHDVQLSRVFIVSREQMGSNTDLEMMKKVFYAQARIVQQFREQGIIETRDKSLFGKGYYIGVRLVDTNINRDYLLRSGYYVGYIRKKEGKSVALSFQPDRSSSPDGIIIRKIIISEVTQTQETEIMKAMQENLNEALDIVEFVSKSLG